MQIAVLGDIHHHWSEHDASWFDSSPYELLLVVGDLAGSTQRGLLEVCRALSRLRKPALLIPGNHDGPNLGQLLGEVVGSELLARAFDVGTGRRTSSLRQTLGDVVVGGYSLHRYGDVDVLVARPHSMGGSSLSFAGHLRRAHGIVDLDASAERLRGLVEASTAPHLVILAHNGPAGLGSERTDIWGCDFRREQGDHGDPDLAAAVEHARRLGKPLRAVVAGHMHRSLRGGGQRVSQVRRSGVLYVNAAEVPRIRAGGRHHVALRISEEEATAEDVWVGRTARAATAEG